MSNLYTIMLKMIDETDPLNPQPFDLNLDNLTQLKACIQILKVNLIAWNDRIKAKLDECKQANYPDFVPDASQPALICSMVHNDNFINYVQKINEFNTTVIDQLEASLLLN